MEEKKKRWRPSLTAYRELEDEVGGLKEQNRLLSREVANLRCEINETCDDGEGRFVSREQYDDALRERDTWKSMYGSLRSRGFWARVFNR